MKWTIAFCFIIFFQSIFGQIDEDFSDGDFTSNPTWMGDVAKFKINNSYKLQLNSTGADTSYLATSNALISNTEWSFYAKQSFNSSSNNHSRIYLVSDVQNLKGTLNGYFVQFGSSQDDISLYRQDGNNLTQIISGTHANTGNSTNSFTIKVTRDTLGNWELFTDASAGTVFVSEGQVFDNTYNSTSYFGVFCKYTTSNSTKFYFDNFLVQSIQIDSLPPNIISLNVVSSHQIDLSFSEAVNDTSASLISNYLVDNGIGQPSVAQLDAQNPTIVHLTFAQNFVLAKKYKLTVGNIKDLAGNVMPQKTMAFYYYIPQKFDVVINEIMADPTPSVGLVPQEYLEIYNTTDFDINLKDWVFINGTTTSILPDSILKSDDYFILCKDDYVSAFQQYGRVIGLSSFSLVNSGQQLVLKNALGGIIHQIKYSDSWYGQSSKADGGWSLEQIDPDNPCGCGLNWWASNSSLGGTPGEINSVDAAQPDIAAPEINRVSVVDSLHILVSFTEPMDSVTILNPAAYFVTDSIGYAIASANAYPSYLTVQLTLNKAIVPKKIYKLQIKDTLKDCVGNEMMINTTVRFGMAELPIRNDLVINEILFNPKDNGVDFVEIYNRSEKIIDLKELKLANYSEELADFENIKDISEMGLAVFPGEYFLLTTDAEMVKKQYYSKNPKNFINMESFPSMSNSDGNIFLITNSHFVLDSIFYDEDMQYPLLQNVEGVSLERVNFDLPSTRDNWHSSSQDVGFATPAYLNSQYSQSGKSPDEFLVSPAIFSPDNDGYNDVLSISYNLSTGTIISKIIIYNSKGQPVKTLVTSYLSGSERNINWDGTTDENQKAALGIYLIYIETLNLNGNIMKYKKVATVGGKL